MRATPRTWPSMRLSRASWDFLRRSSMLEPYPRRVYMASMSHACCRHDHGQLEIAIDPVCGMKVTVAGAKNVTAHDGHTYYFCSPKCLARFTAEPARYLTPASARVPEAPAGTIYTCPMHPQIRQVGPGSCPICGMTLEPVEVTAGAGPNNELHDMSRRFWIGLVLTLPVLILEMGGHIP